MRADAKDSTDSYADSVREQTSAVSGIVNETERWKPMPLTTSMQTLFHAQISVQQTKRIHSFNYSMIDLFV